jgi:hypothetical protein
MGEKLGSLSTKELKEILKKHLIKAFKTLYAKDIKLLENNVNERTIVSKFASYLQNNLDEGEMRGYSVDVEYNRNNKDVKQINPNIEESITDTSNGEVKKKQNRLPDLIVHDRCSCSCSSSLKNILIVEFKKNLGRKIEYQKKKAIDLVKRTLKEFHYELGLYAEFIKPANGFPPCDVTSCCITSDIKSCCITAEEVESCFVEWFQKEL